jgi:hypothetical protein
MRVTVPVAKVVPEVPVTVMVYVPGVVPGLADAPPLFPGLLPPDPHARIPPTRATRSADMANRFCHFRRRAGSPKRRTQARVALPAAYHEVPGRWGLARNALDGAVVDIVRVAVPAVAPVRFTGLVEPKARVGRYCAPAGMVVIAAVNPTLPVKPPLGATVMVEEFPSVAPGPTLRDVALIVNPATGGAATVIEAVPNAAR